MPIMKKEDAILADERPHLIVLRGPSLGDFFALEGDALVLGSDPFRADVVVRDVEVSPKHAWIIREPKRGSYVLRDLGEDTAVNGELLEEERALSEGDRIFVGDSVLEYSHGDPVRADFHGALHRLVSRDYLTGLLVKNRFDVEFEHSLEAASSARQPLSVLMADIDNLKKVNDAHGHLLGEYVVGEIGRIIGRLHEEEGRQATRFEGHAFAEKDATVHPTLSLGVAAYPEDGETRAALTRAADEALYRAKRAGGNTVHE
jgi:GGDEF domain-containing protein